MRYSLLGVPRSIGGRGWKPWTIRTPFLISFIAICLLFIIVIEVLIRACRTSGCPTFGTDPADSSTYSRETSFLYNYLPTILVVGFGLLWTTANHDFMRLEPFFQLSEPDGVLAKDSLLLEYPYTLVLLIPWVAFKRGHWVIVWSSTILLLTTLLLTPLTSGIFDEGTVVQTRTEQGSKAEMFSMDDPARTFSAVFAYIAYEYAWLNGSLLPFTTPEFALAPFNISGIRGIKNETWTGKTTLFEADLICEEPSEVSQVVDPKFGLIGFNISNGEDFSWVLGDRPRDDIMKDISWYNDDTQLEEEIEFYREQERIHYDRPWTGLAIEPPPDQPPGTVLYVWGSPADPDRTKGGSNSSIPLNWTAIFCEPIFYKQSVEATVQMPTGLVQSVRPLDARSLYAPPVFTSNDSLWRFIHLGEAYGSADEDRNTIDLLVGFGYTPDQQPDVDSQLIKRFGEQRRDPDYFALRTLSNSSINVYWPTGLAGFSLYNQTNTTLPHLLESTTLANMYREAFQLLFSFATSSDMIDPKSWTPTSITRESKSPGFKVNLVWSRASQAVLGALCIFTVFLIYLTWQRPCNLDGEPNSLAAAIGLLSRSNRVVARDLDNSEFLSSEKLRGELSCSTRNYHLSFVEGHGPHLSVIDNLGREPDMLPLTIPKLLPLSPIFPLNAQTGMILFIFLTSTLFLLIFLFNIAKNNNGLPTVASSGTFPYKLLYSYLPTILGMLVEPFLVVIGSYSSMIGPYKALDCTNGVGCAKSLALDYDKSPPHFQLIQSLKGGNLPLCALSIAILMANVLAVTLAGLFSRANQAQPFHIPSIAHGFQTPAQEVYYSLIGNLSSTLPAATWTTPEYYIVPFDPKYYDSPPSWGGLTMGFGLDVSCEILPDDALTDACEISPCESPVLEEGHWAPTPQSVYIDDPCFSAVTCGYQADEATPNVFSWYTPAADCFSKSTNCPGTFFIVWAELPGDPNPTNLRHPYKGLAEYVVLRCTSTESVVELTAFVDEARNVLSITNVTALTTEAVQSSYSSHLNNTKLLAPTFLETVQAGLKPVWNGSGGGQLMWWNHLMRQINPSIRTSGPNVTHIPDRALVVETFTSFYKRLFATSLRLYADDIFVFLDSGGHEVVPAATFAHERVEMSSMMFYISSVILAYSLAVVVLLYWFQPKNTLSHMPTTLGGMYTLLYASNVLEVCERIPGNDPKARAERLAALGHQYRLGEYIGSDSRVHYGVHRLVGDDDESSVVE